MSQEIQFQKIKLFADDVAESFPPENVVGSIRALLRGTDQYTEEYIKQFFEHIPLESLTISVCELDQLIPEFQANAEYQLFDPKKITFLLVDSNIWSGIENVVEIQLKDILEAEGQKNKKLEKIGKIMNDYRLLSSLSTKKLLCLNTF